LYAPAGSCIGASATEGTFEALGVTDSAFLARVRDLVSFDFADFTIVLMSILGVRAHVAQAAYAVFKWRMSTEKIHKSTAL